MKLSSTSNTSAQGEYIPSFKINLPLLAAQFSAEYHLFGRMSQPSGQDQQNGKRKNH